MKVVYVPNNNPILDNLSTVKEYALKFITPGKIYHVIDKFAIGELYTYFIIDDSGIGRWYDDDFLIPLEKYREDKLNELGI
jgi:hypothetical protein